MTVRVRSLIRTTAAGRPPVPPVTIRFIQQPTDTVVGELFDPPIAVQISDHRSDVLLISIDSGDCHINGQYAVADANGIARFEGLTAGDFPSNGCVFRVDNLSRPEIPSIRSQPFNALAPQVFFEVVNNGTAYGSAGSTDLVNVTLTLQANGQPFDTTGANLFVMNTNGDEVPTLQYSVNGVTVTDLWNFGGGSFSNRIYYISPPLTGPNTVFQALYASYPAIGVVCLKNWNGQAPILEQWVDYVTTESPFTLRLPDPFLTDPDNLVVVGSLFWRSFFQSAIPSYQTSSSPFNFESTYGNVLSFKLRSSTFEDPFVTFIASEGQPYYAMTGVVFEHS